VKVMQGKQIVYQWRYLALARDSVAATLPWRWRPTLKKETLAACVAAWRQEGMDAIIWEGSGSHRARLVRATGPVHIHLPAYAPELNPPERLFQEIRVAVEGRLSPRLDDKVAAAERVLLELRDDTPRLAQLVGWGWIKEAYDLLPADNTALS
jgi:hypothetical protein